MRLSLQDRVELLATECFGAGVALEVDAQRCQRTSVFRTAIVWSRDGSEALAEVSVDRRASKDALLRSMLSALEG